MIIITNSKIFYATYINHNYFLFWSNVVFSTYYKLILLYYFHNKYFSISQSHLPSRPPFTFVSPHYFLSSPWITFPRLPLHDFLPPFPPHLRSLLFTIPSPFPALPPSFSPRLPNPFPSLSFIFKSLIFTNPPLSQTNLSQTNLSHSLHYQPRPTLPITPLQISVIYISLNYSRLRNFTLF